MNSEQGEFDMQENEVCSEIGSEENANHTLSLIVSYRVWKRRQERNVFCDCCIIILHDVSLVLYVGNAGPLVKTARCGCPGEGVRRSYVQYVQCFESYRFDILQS